MQDSIFGANLKNGWQSERLRPSSKAGQCLGGAQTALQVAFEGLEGEAAQVLAAAATAVVLVLNVILLLQSF